MKSTPERVPVLRRVAAVILALESCALVGASVVYAVRAIDGAAPAEAALSIGALALAAGAALAIAAAAFLRGRTWARGLALTWQLLQVAAGAMLWDLAPAAGAATIAAGVVGVVVIVIDARATPSA